eukprot:1411531-Rhodomonas_salina.2
MRMRERMRVWSGGGEVVLVKRKVCVEQEGVYAERTEFANGTVDAPREGLPMVKADGFDMVQCVDKAIKVAMAPHVVSWLESSACMLSRVLQKRASRWRRGMSLSCGDSRTCVVSCFQERN